MSQDEVISDFQGAMERIYAATGASTQLELALLLGIRQSSISDAKRRRSIPSRWLLMLLRMWSINPEWVLTGEYPMYLATGAEKIDSSVRCAVCPALSTLKRALCQISGCVNCTPKERRHSRQRHVARKTSA